MARRDLGQILNEAQEYLDAGDINKSIQFANEAHELAELTKDYGTVARALNIISLCYFENNNKTQSIKKAKEAMTAALTSKSTRQIAYAYFSLAKGHFLNDKFTKAEITLHEGLKIAKSNKFGDIEVKMLKLQSEIESILPEQNVTEIEDIQDELESMETAESEQEQTIPIEATSKSTERKKPVDTQDLNDFGSDPNKKLALDSDILNDKSATGDLDLGYESYVNAFVALIDNYGKEMAPLTIGLHGEWGAGKTTLMGAIRKKLDEKKYISILFNAWKYKEEESISRAFLRQSLLQVGNKLWWWKKFWYKLKLLRLNYFFLTIVFIIISIPVTYEVSKTINWMYSDWIYISNIIILLILAIISKLQSAGFDLGEKLAKSIGKKTTTDFMGDMEKDMQDFIKIYTKIEKDGKPLIVFIDDLDRCPPERIVDVMNAINTITNLENTIFFLGYDTTIVGTAIGNHYSNILGHGDGNEIKQEVQLQFGLDFLDKIVQIPFRLPRPGFTELNQYIYKVLKVDLVSLSNKDETSEAENLDFSNSEIQVKGDLKLTDHPSYTTEGPGRKNLAAVTAEILDDGVKEYGLSNIRKIKRFINTFRLLYEISSESGLLTRYYITPQQLGYFLYFHLFYRVELGMQVSYMKDLSPLNLEISELTEDKNKPKNKITDKLDIVFPERDSREIEKYLILDQFVRGSVN